MKKVLMILIFVFSLCSSTLHAAQRITAIPSTTQYIEFDYSFCDLHLKSQNSNNYLSSHSVGITHKGVGQNLVYMEHIGYVNWEGSNDRYGFYTKGSVLYRNNIVNKVTNHDLLIAVGMSLDFQFGVIDDEGYTFGQLGPVCGLIYQIPEKGFSFYVLGVAEYIITSQLGDEDLEYSADPFIGLGFGLEYLPAGTSYNLGVEAIFLRESSFAFYFGIRI